MWMSNSQEVLSLCYIQASESLFTLKGCFAAIGDCSPVISGLRIGVTLWGHTQRLRQLGIAIVDAIMDGLQLVSIPLWLVTDQSRIKHVYPKRKKNRVRNKGWGGGASNTEKKDRKSLKQNRNGRGRPEMGKGEREGKNHEEDTAKVEQRTGRGTHCCEFAERHSWWG